MPVSPCFALNTLAKSYNILFISELMCVDLLTPTFLFPSSLGHGEIKAECKKRLELQSTQGIDLFYLIDVDTKEHKKNRIALLVNDSDTAIYLKLGADAVANQGIRLNANGGSYEMSRLHGNLYVGASNAIHGSTGNKVLLVTEGV